VHEVKFVGYHVQTHQEGSNARLYSRNGKDFTERFPSIAQLLHVLPAKVSAFDGEVVASSADGSPNFARRSTSSRSTAAISFCTPSWSGSRFDDGLAALCVAEERGTRVCG